MRVFVPKKASRRLLLLFDGQNVFGDEGSFAGGWHADQAVERLAGTVERPVVAALDHGHHHRNRELWQDLDPLLECVLHRVLPEARQRWDLESTVTLGGASLGGLAAFAGLIRHPSVVRGALCLSPSFWFQGGAIFRELPASFPPDCRIYLDVGLKEGRAMVAQAHHMADALRHLPESACMWRPDKKGRHQEKHWRRRLPRALWFLFRRR